MRKLLILIPAFIFFVVTVHAQEDAELIDPILIELKAILLNAGDSSAIPYANIINHRTHSGTITNNNGYFSLELLNIDTLEVTSVGFAKTILRIPANYLGYDVITFYVQPINYSIGEVKVEGDRNKVNLGFETGKPPEIPVELRGDAFNEKPPVLAAFFSPISYWQYYLSKREKRKREVRRDMAIMKNWEMHSQNYNKEMVMKLTGLNEAYADTFMVWFNGQNVLPYASTEYEVRESIVQYYKLFKSDYDLED